MYNTFHEYPSLRGRIKRIFSKSETGFILETKNTFCLIYFRPFLKRIKRRCILAEDGPGGADQSFTCWIYISPSLKQFQNHKYSCLVNYQNIQKVVRAVCLVSQPHLFWFGTHTLQKRGGDIWKIWKFKDFSSWKKKRERGHHGSFSMHRGGE